MPRQDRLVPQVSNPQESLLGLLGLAAKTDAALGHLPTMTMEEPRVTVRGVSNLPFLSFGSYLVCRSCSLQRNLTLLRSEVTDNWGSDSFVGVEQQPRLKLPSQFSSYVKASPQTSLPGATRSRHSLPC